jgi:hypothetical protein
MLRQILKKRISMRDPAVDHVGSCSPCFSELTEMRQALDRRNLVWAMGTAGAAVLVLAIVAYFAFLRVNATASQDAVQPGAAAVTPKSDDSIPSPPATQALLDLRNFSATRSVQPSGSTSYVPPVEIPRGFLAITVRLPIGSEAGSYEVEIRKPNQPAIQIANATATIENGITTMIINMDTASIQPGEFEFAWRMANFTWRTHPVVIR